MLQYAVDFGSDCLRWTIPASRWPSDLALDIKLIDNFLINPLDPGTGKSVSDLVKKVVKRRTRKEKLVSLSDIEDRGELNEDGEPVKAKKKGRRRSKRAASGSDESDHNVENEGATKRKRKRKAEAIASYISEQFVHDSDE